MFEGNISQPRRSSPKAEMKRGGETSLGAKPSKPPVRLQATEALRSALLFSPYHELLEALVGLPPKLADH